MERMARLSAEHAGWQKTSLGSMLKSQWISDYLRQTAVFICSERSAWSRLARLGSQDKQYYAAETGIGSKTGRPAR